MESLYNWFTSSSPSVSQREIWDGTRSECCNLVKYLYPVIYWRLFKFRVGVRDRSYNMHEITIVVSYWNCQSLSPVTLFGLQRSDRLGMGPVDFCAAYALLHVNQLNLLRDNKH